MIRAVALLALLAVGEPARLAVRTPMGIVEWWRADRAPQRWVAAHPVVTDAVQWHDGAPGVAWGELALAGDGEAWRTRVIVVRLDPRRLQVGVAWGVSGDARPAWSLIDAPGAAVFAVNAGQFTAALPWGWVVADGRERLAPARGPLSSALVVLRDGGVRIIDGDTLEAWRRDRNVTAAFQSYPTLLAGDGNVPAALRAPCPINCTHRDARLAVGIDRDGQLLVALTRFDAAGSALGFVPLGLTVPEMAAIMGALGARQAMLLDGGISAQMMVRNADGETQAWHGMRQVPLALVARPR